MKKIEATLKLNERTCRFTTTICLLLLFLTVPAFGAPPCITDDTGTQGRGKTQIEMTGQYDHDKEEGVKSENWEAKAALSYGLLDPLDLVIEAPYNWTSVKDAEGTIRNDGMGDMTIAVKWRFFDRETISFAVKPFVTLPTGDEDKGLGNGLSSYGVTAIASFAKDPWAFHFNAGVSHNDYKLRDDEDANRSDIWSASLMAELKAVKNLKLVANVGIERNSDVTSDTHPVSALGGLIYSLSESVDMCGGVKWGINDPETDYSFLAGLTFRF